MTDQEIEKAVGEIHASHEKELKKTKLEAMGIMALIVICWMVDHFSG